MHMRPHFTIGQHSLVLDAVGHDMFTAAIQASRALCTAPQSGGVEGSTAPDCKSWLITLPAAISALICASCVAHSGAWSVVLENSRISVLLYHRANTVWGHSF